MNAESRIPKLHSVSLDGALIWFAELQANGLMFHPDDDPAEMRQVKDGKRTFSDAEVSEVRFAMDVLFAELGEGVYDAAYPVVMNSYGLQLDA